MHNHFLCVAVFVFFFFSFFFFLFLFFPIATFFSPLPPHSFSVASLFCWLYSFVCVWHILYVWANVRAQFKFSPSFIDRVVQHNETTINNRIGQNKMIINFQSKIKRKHLRAVCGKQWRVKLGSLCIRMCVWDVEKSARRKKKITIEKTTKEAKKETRIPYCERDGSAQSSMHNTEKVFPAQKNA